MDINSLGAAGKYAAARPATDPEAGANTAGETIRTLASDFAATLQESENLSTAAMTNEADPQSLVTALAQTELAVQTVVSVRDKVVEAYQEILRMPV